MPHQLIRCALDVAIMFIHSPHICSPLKLDNAPTVLHIGSFDIAKMKRRWIRKYDYLHIHSIHSEIGRTTIYDKTINSFADILRLMDLAKLMFSLRPSNVLLLAHSLT